MGEFRDEAVIAVTIYIGWETKDPAILRDCAVNDELAALRDEMRSVVESSHNPEPVDLSSYIVGPIPMSNCGAFWVFCPDGSKEGWERSNVMDAFRERFLDICVHGKARVCDVVMGGDNVDAPYIAAAAYYGHPIFLGGRR